MTLSGSRFRLLNMTRRWILLGLAAAVLSPVCMGQEPPKISVSSSLVLVPVSALDKNGRPIPGLTEADFHIFVDNKPVEVAGFDAVSLAGSAPTPAQPAQPAVYTNRADFSASEGGVVIVLVDYLNTRLADRMALREGLLKYFAKMPMPSSGMAAYGLTRSLVTIQPLTRDPSALMKVAKNLLEQKGQPGDPKNPEFMPGAGTDQGSIPSGSGATDQAMEYLDIINARRAFNIDQVDRRERTLEAFRDLAGAYSGVAGKKTVLWLTGDASPLNPSLLYRNVPNKQVETPEANWLEIAKTYEALNSASMSLFPIDLRGVTNPGLFAAGENVNHGTFVQMMRGSQPGDATVYTHPADAREGEEANAFAAMESVAAETGGRVLAGSNDVGELLQRANGLWTSYYMLAIRPEKPSPNQAPIYHTIRVSVRRKDVQVLARRGYLARPDELLKTETEERQDILAAADSPLDMTGVGLELRMTGSPVAQPAQPPQPAQSAQAEDKLPFALKIAGSVMMTGSQGAGSFDVSVVTLLCDQTGKTWMQGSKEIRGTTQAADTVRAQTYGMTWHGEFERPAQGDYFGKVIVRDNLTGRMGTLTVTLPARH